MAAPGQPTPQLSAQTYPFEVKEGLRPKNVGVVRASSHYTARETSSLNVLCLLLLPSLLYPLLFLLVPGRDTSIARD